MKPRVQVIAPSAAVSRYRNLLTSDSSGDAIEDVFSLCRKVVQPTGAPKPAWWPVLEPRRDRKAVRDFDLDVIERVRTISALFPWAVAPLTTRPPDKRSRKEVSSQAEACWTWLLLPVLADVTGETGFFMEVQSLLFLTALQELLPELKDAGLEFEHDCLLNAMLPHLQYLWPESPEHALYLESQLMDYLGQTRGRDRSLRQAILLTAPEDHSYLTKVQEYWSNLLDEDRAAEALDFLLPLLRTAPPENTEELVEMANITYERLEKRGKAS